MEEKKLKAAEPKKQERREPTYEDLKNYCNQLMMQRNQLAEKLNQITDVLNKMPWLFKVIENASMFRKDFVGACAEEIELIMTPPKADEKDDKESKN